MEGLPLHKANQYSVRRLKAGLQGHPNTNSITHSYINSHHPEQAVPWHNLNWVTLQCATCTCLQESSQVEHPNPLQPCLPQRTIPAAESMCHLGAVLWLGKSRATYIQQVRPYNTRGARQGTYQGQRVTAVEQRDRISWRC